jgi:cyclopropane fatty-acyl-phospholipid synthase-like methyltransferase
LVVGIDVTARFDASQIKRYYDRHTASFLRFGQGGGSIHRAVWGPGTTTRDDAFHFVDERIAWLVRRLLPSTPVAHVVDLGCGVGASLRYLAERLPIRGTGITLSPVQAALGRRAIAAAGLSDRVECLEGDYCNLPSTVGPADLAYAIESFVHSLAPGRFFEQCGRLVKVGGLLVVCDDVKRRTDGAEAARAIEQFTSGWHINALLERDEFLGLANTCGFEHESTIDLTTFLELGRRRDRVIAALLALVERLPIDAGPFDHVIGGRALQTCLARGWIGYDFMVFRRT